MTTYAIVTPSSTLLAEALHHWVGQHAQNWSSDSKHSLNDRSGKWVRWGWGREGDEIDQPHSYWILGQAWVDYCCSYILVFKQVTFQVHTGYDRVQTSIITIKAAATRRINVFRMIVLISCSFAHTIQSPTISQASCSKHLPFLVCPVTLCHFSNVCNIFPEQQLHKGLAVAGS